MPILTVRNLDPAVHQRLRELAAAHGRSMEAEARAILAAGVRRDADVLDVFQVVQDHFADLDLAGFEIPARTDLPRQVDFGGDDE